MERRRFPRISLAGDAEITAGGATVRGNVFNISVEGAFIVLTSEATILNGDCLVTLSFPEARMPLAFQSLVVRSSTEGIAVRFRHSDVVSLAQLKNFLSFNDIVLEQLVKEAVAK